MANELGSVIGVARVGLLDDEVGFAIERWNTEPHRLEKLNEVLDQPGDKADVISRFICWENESVDVSFDATSLRKKEKAEIDCAFNDILSYLRGLGRSGLELANNVRSKIK